MNRYPVPKPRWYDGLQGRFLRLAASGTVPARWFLRDLPPPSARAAREGSLSLEIVSHCWRYAHMLVYQLSSLVLYPPRELTVTMTVYYCEEDQATVDLLTFFSTQQVPGVSW